MKITQEVASKVLEVVDAGLVRGVGEPVPGNMCVEAAVCYALGLPHGDDPKCVSPPLRQLKIRLNDSNWSSNDARAKGLRRLAVAQLGSKGNLNDVEFSRRVAQLVITTCVPVALRAAAPMQEDAKHRQALTDAADGCEREGTRDAAANAANAAYAAAYAADAADAANAANAAYAAADAAADAAYAAANAAAYAANAAANAADAANAYAQDRILSDYAEGVVQILVDMNAPGCKWLPLTEVEA